MSSLRVPAEPLAPSTRMSRDARREQLLDVTKAIAVERGFHAVSIEAVAREAGITRPIVYGHFGDLGGLLEALVARESARALSQLAVLLPTALQADDARSQLLAAYESYLRAARADPGTWRLVVMPPEGAPASLREAIETGREAVVAVLAQAVSGGFPPEQAPPDPDLLARMLSALSDESVRLLLTDPDTYPVERLLGLAGWILDRLTETPT